ncbi:DNA methyltransferase [Paludibacter sp. 221]|uniref:DNA adenine methylase n=1 Tax=Paludibacter sp. 221 TaxID=2302939 RepID=UPI0013D6C578|nr:DNA adenine methylase [Paludibacter sp. 221]NDV46704.1 DNA methyltransferase [Paludibacter sp. 221]
MLTEGIKYAGSKLKILPYIFQIISEIEGIDKVLDGFSGSTRVSQAFAQSGYSVTSNDISAWSEVLATCYLLPSQPDNYFQEIINYLNNLPGYDGWFTEHYGGNQSETKKPFQIKNTRKLDAVRDEIERLNLPWNEKCVLLTSLILALDKVDNTLGHYVAYLSKWSKRSYNDLYLTLPKRFPLMRENYVLSGDVFDAVKGRAFDLAYFDPPYGSNNDKMPPSRVRYASYYHFWTTVIRNDQPELFGKANRREDTRDDVSASVFEDYKKTESGRFFALEALRQLIKETNTHYLLLSYSSGGRATKEQLTDVISEFGRLKEIKKIDYRKNVMSSMRSTNKWTCEDDSHCEYLFLMEK